MQRRSLFLGPVVALLLVAMACGGDDGGGGQASTDEGGSAAPTTTEATPANPEGDFYLVRWIESSDNEAANTQGLATMRAWSFTPTCDGDEPCDLTLTGGGEGGSYDPPGFPAADPLPDATLTYDDGAWVLDEELGAYANCRGEDGQYVDGDFTTMDEVDHTELSWDEDGERLVGTKTETYTLNDAGRANPECSADSDEVVTFGIVAVPTDQFDEDVTDEVDLADSYRQTREVYSVEGIDTVVVHDDRVNLEPTEGEGSCGADACDATLTPAGVGSPQVLELEIDDGDLTASFEGTGSCSSNASIAAGGEPEILTEDGYDDEWQLELTPIVVEDGAPPLLIGNGQYTATPLPEAAEQFPDDCASTETIGAYWYFLPDELVS